MLEQKNYDEILSALKNSNPVYVHGDEIREVKLNAEVENDIINNPNHYADTKYECREVSAEIFKDLKGIEAIDSFNVFKYIWRWHKKNGLQDLEKCKNYLEHLIKEVSNK